MESPDRLSIFHKLLDGETFRREKRNRASEHDYQVTHMENTAEHAGIQGNLQHFYADGEDYVRENPAKTALVAMGIGLLLAQLPLRWMLIAIIKVLFLVVKPVTFVYAISKLIDDIRAAKTE